MHQKNIDRHQKAVRAYLERRQLYPFRVVEGPPRDLGAVVVIPCFNEPDVCAPLDSLRACRSPGCNVEILVVINAPQHADPAVLEANQASLEAVRAWCGQPLPAWLTCHTLEYHDLPPRHAGVGLARKLGMDEGAARLAQAGRPGGLLISLDADCRVDPGYLDVLLSHFRRYPACPGVSVYFEHPLDLHGGDPVHRAVAEYELHLRFYVAGMRHAGFPYAFHTVGSAMACRAIDYARLGGMNRRKGGEDFYFIQKLAACGNYRSLTATTVYPGVRLSARVPFGTGPAVARNLRAGRGQQTYAVEIFEDLAGFCATAPELFEASRGTLGGRYAPALRAYLEQAGFDRALCEIRANVAGTDAFRMRLFRWFNAFRFFRFAQFASRNFYPRMPVVDASFDLMRSISPGASAPVPRELSPLLRWYRLNDRRGAC